MIRAARRMATPIRAAIEERHGFAGARRTSGGMGAISGPALLMEADAGIDEAIEDIDEEVADDEAERDQQDHALHGRIVTREHGVDHQAAHAGQREDVLRDDGTADE